MKRISKAAVFFLATLLTQKASSQAPGWFTKVNAQLEWSQDGPYTFSVTDVNNDDYPDIVMLYVPSGADVYAVRKPLKVFLNVADSRTANPSGRKFIDITAQTQINIVPPDTGNHANCFTLADFDNDGNVDLVTGNFYYKIENYTLPNDRCQVFMGDGTGNFTWKPDNGLQSLPLINVRTLTALDYDRDGNLDLFIASWFRDYSNNVFDHGYLMKGNGDGTFTDVTNASGIQAFPEPMYSSAATDWNNDCNPDIFTAPYCRTGGKLLKNEGNGQFSNAAAAAGYDLYRRGNGQQACTFTVVPEDVNNDGNMDVFLSVVHGGNAPGEFRSTIAINKGPQFNYSLDIREDLLPVASPASYHRGDYDGAFLDFDNDGYKDLVMTQANYMPATDRTYFWKQQSDHTFKDVTGALGLLVPDLKASSAIEVIDYDMDGDDDLMLIGAGSIYFDLWQNNIGSRNNHIAVKMVPDDNSGINKSAIGARAYVYYQGKMQMREVMAGRGMHTGQQPFILNFGLGDATSVDSIVVQWPERNCRKTTVYNPKINEVAVINSFSVNVPEVKPAVSEIKVFPNPASEYLVIQSKGITQDIRDVTVSDITGKTIAATFDKSDTDKLVFRLSGLPDGVYFVKLTFVNAQTVTHKIVKDSSR